MPTPLKRTLALLGHQRYVQQGAILASSEQARYPVSNLGNTSLWSSVWRSEVGEIEGVSITFNLGAPKSVQAIVLVGTNFSRTATRSIACSNNADLSSPVHSASSAAAFNASIAPLVDDDPPWGVPMIYLRVDDAITAQYHRVTISDPDNQDGYLRAAIGLVEPAWQPIRNFATEWSRADKLSGDEATEQTLRGHRFPLHRLIESEERQVVSLQRKFRRTGRMFVIPQPLRPETWLSEAWWGVFDDLSEASCVDQLGRFRTLALNFTEVDE